jgi:protoporphyrinogen/coproporphyrinogen III oxidase
MKTPTSDAHPQRACLPLPSTGRGTEGEGWAGSESRNARESLVEPPLTPTLSPLRGEGVAPVAIVGAGVTGLVAAFYLKRARIPVTLYESSERTGGVIRTVSRDGFLAECGPNSILETSPVVRELVSDLGLDSKRVYSAPAASARYLVRNGKLVLVPATPLGMFTSPLFSLPAKLRVALEPLVPRSAAGNDESVAQFVTRRLGREFLDRAINPLVAGIYAGDPTRLSLKHAFPKLHDVEQRYRSLIVGQIRGACERRERGEVSKQNAPKFSFVDGLQTLTDALARELEPNLRLRTPVAGLDADGDNWRLEMAGAVPLHEEHSVVLLAAPSHRLAQLRLSHSGTPLTALRGIRYAPITTLVFGFRRSDVAHPLNGFGVLVPEVEKRNILGAIFSSSLFPGRAPADHVTLTVYLGGMRSPELPGLPIARQIELALSDLRELLGVTGAPVFTHPTVFAKAIPQYELGFGDHLERMKQIEDSCPGVFLAGHFRNGISLSDCIVAGREAARRIAQHLNARSIRRESVRSSFPIRLTPNATPQEAIHS